MFQENMYVSVRQQLGIASFTGCFLNTRKRYGLRVAINRLTKYVSNVYFTMQHVQEQYKYI